MNENEHNNNNTNKIKELRRKRTGREKKIVP